MSPPSSKRGGRTSRPCSCWVKDERSSFEILSVELVKKPGIRIVFFQVEIEFLIYIWLNYRLGLKVNFLCKTMSLFFWTSGSLFLWELPHFSFLEVQVKSGPVQGSRSSLLVIWCSEGWNACDYVKYIRFLHLIKIGGPFAGDCFEPSQHFWLPHPNVVNLKHIQLHVHHYSFYL